MALSDLSKFLRIHMLNLGLATRGQHSLAASYCCVAFLHRLVIARAVDAQSESLKEHHKTRMVSYCNVDILTEQHIRWIHKCFSIGWPRGENHIIYYINNENGAHIWISGDVFSKSLTKSQEGRHKTSGTLTITYTRFSSFKKNLRSSDMKLKKMSRSWWPFCLGRTDDACNNIDTRKKGLSKNTFKSNLYFH